MNSLALSTVRATSLDIGNAKAPSPILNRTDRYPRFPSPDLFKTLSNFSKTIPSVTATPCREVENFGAIKRACAIRMPLYACAIGASAASLRENEV